MNNQTKQKAFNVLSEIWTLYKNAPIHYTTQRQVYEKYKITRTLFHMVVNCGYGIFPDRGYFILNQQPTAEMIDRISKYQSSYSREKIVQRKSAQIQLLKESITNYQSGTIDEPGAVKLLKSLGYKIMKPIAPQFEEI